jgi:transcriptional regulator NrdR family protein
MKKNKQQGGGIRCPKCNSSTKVRRTEPLPEVSIQLRSRICDKCGMTIETEEKIVSVGVTK